MKTAIGLLLVTGVLIGAYAWLTLHWPYSVGQRAGYVQRLSRMGGTCKTWEGELMMVGNPLSSKFAFSVPSDLVAKQLNANMGKLVALQYDQHKGLLSSCFGRSTYFITGFRVIEASPIRR